MGHLLFVICHLSFVICHLSFVICHLLDALHVFAAFWMAAHDVASRNHTDSKNNPHDDENDMKYWHRIFIIFYIVACFYIS